MIEFEQRLVDRRRAWVAERRREGVEGVFKAQAIALPLPPSFHDAVRVPRAELAAIADVRRRAPGRGDHAWDVDIAELVCALERAGATALAIHVEDEHYGGCYQDLLLAAQVTSLPILCRDVVLDPLQITMARAHGAAAVVLDASLVDEMELRALFRAALDLGLDIVVECRSAQDLETALRVRRGSSDSGSVRIVGVRGGPITTDDTTYERLVQHVPDFVVSLAMCDVGSRVEAERLEALGYDAFFVGDAILDAEDPGAALRAIAGEPVAGDG